MKRSLSLPTLLANHRKSHPKLRHAEFAKLDDKDQGRVEVLAAILRIADGLDRTHRRVVWNVEATHNAKNISIITQTTEGEEWTFEYWSAERKKGLMEEIFNRKVRLQMNILETEQIV